MYRGFPFSFGFVTLGWEVLRDISRSDPRCSHGGSRAAEPRNVLLLHASPTLSRSGAWLDSECAFAERAVPFHVLAAALGSTVSVRSDSKEKLSSGSAPRS